jgi:hypothetical protein
VQPTSPPQPSEAERAAAFDLQVELALRVGVQPLTEGQGSLREALTSLHSLFTTAREVLHRIGPQTSASRVHALVVQLLNEHLRPFLSTWHPALEVHEAERTGTASRFEHESRWERSAEMRRELAGLQAPLTDITKALSEVSGADLLTTAAD